MSRAGDGHRSRGRLRHRTQPTVLSTHGDEGRGCRSVRDVGKNRAEANRGIAVSVEIVGLSAEKIPVADASFDSIVSTFTLCTIPDVASALLEMRRALRPGGHFYFVEHGRAQDPKVERWQERLNSMEQKVFGGCHLNRWISALIEQAGFEMERLENAYLKGAPKFGGFLYRGVAKRAGS